MVTAPHFFQYKFLSKFNPYVFFFITLGQKLDRVVWFQIFVYLFYVHEWDVLRMYVLCTLPMYHLSTHDRNLYTFAQSTQCLYICSYFMSPMIFLYMCMCQIFARIQWKIDTYYQIDSIFVYLCKCDCYDPITFFSVWEK